MDSKHGPSGTARTMRMSACAAGLLASLLASSAAFAQAPAARWPMEEGSGSVLLDASGNGNHAALSGEPAWSSGIAGLRALVLNGTSQFGVASDSPSLSPPDAITLAAWIRPGGASDQSVLKKAATGTVDGYELGLSSSGVPFVRFNEASSGDLYRLDGVTAYPTDGSTWMHLAATYDGTTMRLYVNGTLDSSKAVTTGIASNSLGLGVGADADGGGPFGGALDEARVYASALSDADVTDLAGVPTVTVNRPNGGEGWTAGSTHQITWSASDNVGVTTVDIELSTDSGATWTPIVSDLANSGGYFWGVTNTPGALNRVRVTAHDAALNSFSDVSDIVFTIHAQPLITSTSPLPNAEVGVPYSHTLTSTGGTPPRNWSVFTGALPAGLTLNTITGEISGTPTSSGASTFTIRLTDGEGIGNNKLFDLEVVSSPVITSTSPLPNAQVGVAYSHTLTASGGVTPYAWAVSIGALPAGLNLNAATGEISGTPTAYGPNGFTIELTDSASVVTSQAFALTVDPATLLITSTSPLPNAQVGVAYSHTLTASGGVTPYAWTVSIGALPAGLNLNASTGEISGTPTTYGPNGFTIELTDSASVVTTKAFALTVDPAALVITSTSPLPNAQVGAAYAHTLTATGGATPYAWTVSIGALPAGLNLSASTGEISGTPTAYGPSGFTIELTDSASVVASQAFALTVDPAALVITSTSPLPNAQVGVAYSHILTASGGATPYAWAVSLGALPDGLALNASTGEISGTPTAYGENGFTIELTDSASVVTSQAFALTVDPAALVITSTSPLPNAQVGVAYSHTLTASGGVTPYYWAVSIGALPAGLNLNASTGEISGTPTSYGPSGFTIELTDSASVVTSHAFALAVDPAPLAITSTSPLPNAQVTFAYSHMLTKSGGVTPHTWAVTYGALPAGLNLNAATGEISGTPSAHGTSSFRVRLTDGASVRDSVTLSLHVAPDPLGPVGLWRFEEGGESTIQDISGWGNNGRPLADATWTAGLFGLGLELDGDEDRASVPDSATLDLTTALTLAAWVKPEQVADQVVMTKAIAASADGYELGLSSTGQPFVRFNEFTSGDLYRVNGTVAYPSSGTTWMHLAATYDGAEIRLYVNGVLDSAKSASLSVAANGLPLMFGAQDDFTRAYRGGLDEFQMFARALSPGEIAALAVLPPVAVEAVPLPGITLFAKAMPNPFRSGTTFEYALSTSGRVEMSIFDVGGRRVRMLERGVQTPGVHRVQWDGRDDAGNSLEAGVYFARLETPRGAFNKRIVHLN